MTGFPGLSGAEHDMAACSVRLEVAGQRHRTLWRPWDLASFEAR